MLFYLLCATMTWASETDIQQSFVEFLMKHRPDGYATPTEMLARYQIFRTNYLIVEAHNAAQSAYRLELNKFSDLSQEEFSSAYLSFPSMPRTIPIKGVDQFPLSSNPTAFDWAEKGGVTQVENGGQLGNSILLSVVKSVETLHFATSGTLIPLSTQQIIDCHHGYDSPYDYMTYLVFAGGLMSAKDYPSNNQPGECMFDRTKITAPMKSFTELGKFNQTGLEDSLVQGTIAVGIDASSPAFQFYRSGIINGNCGKEVDHYVLLVGYGEGFWRVQNTWGADWGEEGYARILKGGDSQQWGECGIAIAPIRPTN